MNRILKILLLLTLFCNTANAQLRPPHYPGGDSAFNIYLLRNQQYPQNIDTAISGSVYVHLTIDTAGYVVNPWVEKGLGEAFDIEALRLVLSMPRWEPARDEAGNPIAVSATIPIAFFAPIKKNEVEAVDDSVPYVQPMFPGGKKALAEFIQSQLLQLVDEKSKNQCKGTKVHFLVEKDGTISNIKYSNASEQCVEILDKLMANMPLWIPGRTRGKPAQMGISLPISF